MIISNVKVTLCPSLGLINTLMDSATEEESLGKLKAPQWKILTEGVGMSLA